ncbi:hypothetical protein [Devosia sp. 2618]|uniref:hypothetical protein n=1 Tax=Devosia sp. 2618 TaxID=3156454 RepID=UPI003390FFC1
MRVLVCTVLFFPNVSMPASADCIGDIVDAISRRVTGGPYQSITTVPTADLQFETVSTFVPPKAYAGVSSIGDTRTEVVVIGDEARMRNTNAFTGAAPAWMKLPPGAATPLRSGAEGRVAPEELRGAHCPGERRKEGAPYQFYSYSYSRQARSFNVELLVDPVTGLPVEERISAAGDGSANTAVTLYRYDDTVTVDRPAD